jgi:enamine deaminase RidA (YjgF/YER057c/UK114 family)
MKRIRLAGQLAEPVSHYTDGVEAAGFLYVSGMLPLDAAGELVGAGDVIRQSEQVLDNVGAVLTAAGATFDDIVRSASTSGIWPTASPSTRCAAATSATPARLARWWKSARSPTQKPWWK